MDKGTTVSDKWDGREITSNIDDTDTILLQIQEKAAMAGAPISISELRRLTQVINIESLNEANMQAVIDQIVALAQQAEQKRHIKAKRSLNERLNSYALAFLAQRMAMGSAASTLAYKRPQARKLIRRYNRR